METFDFYVISFKSRRVRRSQVRFIKMDKSFNEMTWFEKAQLFLEVGLIEYEEIVRKAEREIIDAFQKGR